MPADAELGLEGDEGATAGETEASLFPVAEPATGTDGTTTCADGADPGTRTLLGPLPAWQLKKKTPKNKKTELV